VFENFSLTARKGRPYEKTSGTLTIERVPLITSLAPGEATGPQLAAWIRGHWGMENLLYHVRDRAYREDDSKIRTGHLPPLALGVWPSGLPSLVGSEIGVTRG
jgi:hypothetical protein